MVQMYHSLLNHSSFERHLGCFPFCIFSHFAYYKKSCYEHLWAELCVDTFSFLWDNVLVCLGCYNQIPQTGWLINNRTVLLTVTEAGSARSSLQHSHVLVKALFWFTASAFSLCPLVVEGARTPLGSLF